MVRPAGSPPWFGRNRIQQIIVICCFDVLFIFDRILYLWYKLVYCGWVASFCAAVLWDWSWRAALVGCLTFQCWQRRTTAAIHPTFSRRPADPARPPALPATAAHRSHDSPAQVHIPNTLHISTMGNIGWTTCSVNKNVNQVNSQV